MAQSAEDKAKAAAIVAGWTWQPAEGHNYRYRYATRTLTRFYEAASMQPDEVKLVVEYLRDQEIAAGEGISLLNRTVDFGEGWKAKDAWYQTTPGEKFANTDSTKIRVYQILYQAPEDKSGDGPYTVENGCAYKSTHTFYWDVEELPTLPASSSGVEYSMKGVTRDGETGLFSCVVEKRERVQQDVADYVTQETVFEKRSEEQHIGVKADKVSSTGKAASVADGKIVTRKITKNADCTSDVANTTEVEKGVKSSVVTVRKTLRGTVKTTLDRNQATAAETTGLSVGDEVRVEKTPGGLYNNTKSGVTAEAAGEIVKSCEDSGAVVHTDVVTKNETSAAEITHDTAGVNVVKRVTSRRTEEGTYDNETRVTTFKPATATSKTNWATETSTTKVTRHNTTLDASPSGNYGTSSASPDDNGAATTEVTSYTPNAIDTGWITWESTTETPSYTYKYENGLRILCNVETVPTPPKGCQVSVSVRVNKFGRYDGTISYTQLASWVKKDSSGSTQGGSATGTVSFYQYKVDKLGQSWRRKISVGAVSYTGSGNWGSEASAQANQTVIAGLNLGSRTYATGAPTEGLWERI